MTENVNGTVLRSVINVVNKSNNPLPEYATEGSSGMDLRADLDKVDLKFIFNGGMQNSKEDGLELCINPGGRALIPTGLKIALPIGFEAHVRARSGLALKHGISLANNLGTIDPDYRGDIGVILINHGTEPFIVHQGDRIAQLVISRYEQVKLNEVESLDKTERGEGGFGHTGI